MLKFILSTFALIWVSIAASDGELQKESLCDNIITAGELEHKVYESLGRDSSLSNEIWEIPHFGVGVGFCRESFDRFFPILQTLGAEYHRVLQLFGANPHAAYQRDNDVALLLSELNRGRAVATRDIDDDYDRMSVYVLASAVKTVMLNRLCHLQHLYRIILPTCDRLAKQA